MIETTAARDSSYLQIVSATDSFDEGVVSCEARNRIDRETTYAVIKVQESNIYTIVLVAMILIAIIVFIVIFALFIAPCLYSKHMKKSRGKFYFIFFKAFKIFFIGSSFFKVFSSLYLLFVYDFKFMVYGNRCLVMVIIIRKICVSKDEG